MKRIRQLTALILAMAMCLSLLSANVWASEEPSEDASAATQSVQEEQGSEEETEEPAEDTGEESEQDGPAEAAQQPAAEISEDEASEEAVQTQPEQTETQEADQAEEETEPNPEQTEAAGHGVYPGKRISYKPENGENMSPEEALDAYVREEQSLQSNEEHPARSAGSRLTGSNRKFYEKLKDGISQVAKGERSSTVFEVSVEELGLSDTSWTAEELGVDHFYEDGVYYAILDQIGFDLSTLHDALLLDEPFRLYWYDKTIGISFMTPGVQEYNGRVNMVGSFVFSFQVAQAYADADAYADAEARDEFTTDTDAGKCRAVSAAADNALSIVEQYEGDSDYQKLKGYKDKICELVSYNDEAVEEEDVPYGDPWQCIWVFDNDPETNVVCEGYSKAFQHLCDNTSFSDNAIRCMNVSGDMEGGPHMWNTVHMDDGKNYLVDVTNCDEGAIGYPDWLFLCGAQGSVKNGYTVDLYDGVQIEYQYDDHVIQSLGENNLTLSATDYDPDGQSGQGEQENKCGANLTWTLENGTLTISGTGEMDNWDSEKSPWYEYHANINSAVIEDGVTSIGAGAFYWCYMLTSATIPDSVTSIGDYAFDSCESLPGITIPGSVISIGASAFANCDSLTSVNIPDGVTSIGDGMFAGCSSLPGVTIPDSVTSIGAYAFASCIGIPNITIPNSVTSIGTQAFYRCTRLTSITIPDNVSIIGEKALGYYWNYNYGFDVVKAEFEIVGYSGSAAQTYATENGIPFVVLHTWDAGTVTTPATCKSEGVKTYTCTGCNATYTESIEKDPNNHDGGTERRNYKAATCGEDGYTGDTYCLGCGVMLSSGEPIPATGNHTWDAGTVTTQPTTTAEGLKTYTCTVCHQTRPEPVAKLEQPEPQPTLSATKGLKVKVKKTTATVTWKKNTSGNGYQIQYSTDPTFATGVKTKKVKKNKTVKATIKKLKKKTTYYFRIRTTKGSQFSAWSGVKKVKVKK